MASIESILKISKELPLAKGAIINMLYTYGFINRQLNDTLKPFDISIQQFNVLRILRGQANKPASLEMVQERMINKMSNTTRLIDKLIKKGYVNKNINKANKRKIDISITQDGINFLDRIDVLIDNTESNIVSSLSTEEVKELIRLLGKIRSLTRS